MTDKEALDYFKKRKSMGLDDIVQEAENQAIKALERVDVLDNIKAIVSGWKADTWTDNASYECMVKIADIVEGRSWEK